MIEDDAEESRRAGDKVFEDDDMWTRGWQERRGATGQVPRRDLPDCSCFHLRDTLLTVPIDP